METYYICVMGADHGGRTDFIRAVSENDPIREPIEGVYADLAIQPEALGIQAGQITIDEHLRLWLVRLPGPRQYDAQFWRNAGPRLLGVALLVNSTIPASWRQAHALVQWAYTSCPVPSVIVFGWQDTPEAWAVADLQIVLRTWAGANVVACQQYDRATVKRVLVALLEAARVQLENDSPTIHSDFVESPHKLE